MKNRMFIAFSLYLILLLAGCAVLSQGEQDAINCSKDPVCYDLAKSRAGVVKDIAGTFNPVVGGAAGAFVLALGLWWGGKRKREQANG